MRDNLGDRMKTFYERIPNLKLMRRCPVICRVDGRAFHTFARNFRRPFDDVLIDTIQKTTRYLCENVQGCVLGYTQSDEISLVLVDYKRLNSSSWFDYEVQKMCSIIASMATLAFNRIFEQNVYKFENYKPQNIEEHEYKYLIEKYYEAKDKGAMFDARVFNIPKEEVTNYIYWRQLDASRNSVQMVGRANFSHKELQNKTNNDIQEMLMTQKGINWNDFPTYQKRGACVVKNEIVLEKVGVTVRCKFRDLSQNINSWIIDKDIPVFKGEGREYIEQLINALEE